MAVCLTKADIPPMDTEDLIQLPGSSNSGHGSENVVPCESGHEANKSDPLPFYLQLTNEIDGETPGTVMNGLLDTVEAFVTTDSEKEADANMPALSINFEMKGSVDVVEKTTSISSMHIENACVAVQSEIGFNNDERDETFLSKKEKDASCIPFSCLFIFTCMSYEEFSLGTSGMIIDGSCPMIRLLFIP